jgi:phosphoribosylamine--glycine ligase
MNILLIGSGGREHALAWKLSQSPRAGTIFAAPGNPGIAEHARCVVMDVTNHEAVTQFCQIQNISLVVIGPEAPLVAGLADDLKLTGIKVFGPDKAPAQLEGSKAFTKELCAQYNIPTARYRSFTDADAAKTYIREQGAPIVVKADGLAGGKGVVVAETVEDALNAIDMMFAGDLGEAGSTVVVEEFLSGEEASLFCLSDGQNVKVLGGAQDHKRVFDGDRGPNTGGMGAYSPAPVLTAELEQRAVDEIVIPTVKAMHALGTPYIGVLYAGLMLTQDGPKLIEYNARFGDPECQVLMMRLHCDLLDIMLATVEGRLDALDIKWSDDPALTVVMAAQGYPGTVAKGSVIHGLDKAGAGEGVKIFHAGTARTGQNIVANGGRVLNITATAPTLEEARKRAYEAVDLIDWPEGFCRRDIGWRALE